MSTALDIEERLLEHCEMVVAAMRTLQGVSCLAEYTLMTRAVWLLVNVTVRIPQFIFPGFLSDRLKNSTI